MFGKDHLFGGGFSFSIFAMKKTDFAVSSFTVEFITLEINFHFDDGFLNDFIIDLDTRLVKIIWID